MVEQLDSGNGVCVGGTVGAGEGVDVDSVVCELHAMSRNANAATRNVLIRMRVLY